MLNRQAHHARNMPSAHIAKVTRRHGKAHLLIVGGRGGKIAFEVIHDLRRNPCPVNRVNRANLVGLFEGVIVRHCFNNILAIVKYAIHRNIENIRLLQTKHLCGLETAHFAVWR